MGQGATTFFAFVPTKKGIENFYQKVGQTQSWVRPVLNYFLTVPDSVGTMRLRMLQLSVWLELKKDCLDLSSRMIEGSYA